MRLGEREADRRKAFWKNGVQAPYLSFWKNDFARSLGTINKAIQRERLYWPIDQYRQNKYQNFAPNYR
jgi:hypothetical protein